MAYGYIVSDVGPLPEGRDVDDSRILDIRARTDFDVVHVTAQHAVEPDVRIIAYLDVADDMGAWGDEDVFADFRHNAFVWPELLHRFLQQKKRPGKEALSLYRIGSKG
jgi:hypothetical protein